MNQGSLKLSYDSMNPSGEIEPVPLHSEPARYVKMRGICSRKTRREASTSWITCRGAMCEGRPFGVGCDAIGRSNRLYVSCAIGRMVKLTGWLYVGELHS